MGDWIGNRVEEALGALRGAMYDLKVENNKAHVVLDSYDIPQYTDGELSRPLTLSERIQLNHEKDQNYILKLCEQLFIASNV